MRTILVDADIIAYRVSSALEKAIDWGEDLWTLHADASEGRAAINVAVDRIINGLNADDLVVCLTDPINFRTKVYPPYKGNRNARKPLILGEMKRYLAENFPSYQRPGLEADDIMGILSTHPKIIKGEKVVVTVDKDLRSVPGLFAHMDTMEVEEITEAAADYQHLYQTLTGDNTDGYPGCPGVGPKTAEKILVDPTWDAVVAAFNKAGFGEEEALVQARVARILRACDYDFKNKEVKLWTP